MEKQRLIIAAEQRSTIQEAAHAPFGLPLSSHAMWKRSVCVCACMVFSRNSCEEINDAKYVGLDLAPEV